MGRRLGALLLLAGQALALALAPRGPGLGRSRAAWRSPRPASFRLNLAADGEDIDWDNAWKSYKANPSTAPVEEEPRTTTSEEPEPQAAPSSSAAETPLPGMDDPWLEAAAANKAQAEAAPAPAEAAAAVEEAAAAVEEEEEEDFETITPVPKKKMQGFPEAFTRAQEAARRTEPYPEVNPPKPPYSRRGPGRLSGPESRERAAEETSGFGFRSPQPARRVGGSEFRIVDVFQGGGIFLAGLGGISLLLAAMIYIGLTGGITNSESRFGVQMQEDVPTIQEDMTV